MPYPVDLALAPVLLATTGHPPRQGNRSMSRSIKIDTTWQRIELTGPWAGFGFQAGHLWTPEDHTLHPNDMVWMSLTCNIAREWRLMMAEARSPAGTPRARHASKPLQHKACGVINLRDVLMNRKTGSPGARGGQRREA